MFYNPILYFNPQIIINIRIYVCTFLSDNRLIPSINSIKYFLFELSYLNNRYLVVFGRSICLVNFDTELVGVSVILLKFDIKNYLYYQFSSTFKITFSSYL